MKNEVLILALFCVGITACATPSRVSSPTDRKPESVKTCAENVELHTLRAAELQAVVKADQKEREDWQKRSADELKAMNQHDIQCRKRVGEIFGEGCFKTAADFSAAALVFQHGDVADHFFQAFIWAQRAVELGEAVQKSLESAALDRYLVNTGRKQLFASQARMEDGICFCMQQVESTFPDDERPKYLRPLLRDAFHWVDSLNKDKHCKPAQECKEQLSPTPRGSIPGFW